MEDVRATYRITTPMFCAGGRQDTAELRLPSFKGLLRFWWRTLAWGSVFTADELGRSTADELRRREDRLFGSTAGMSPWIMRKVDARCGEPLRKNHTLQEVGEGARYLGYGVMKPENKGGTLARGCLPAPAEVTFGLRLRSPARKNVTDEDHQMLERALVLLGLVGGMGSKARKGYGSMTLTRLVVGGKEKAIDEDLFKAIPGVLGPLSEEEPQWTAWSRHSRVVLLRPSDAGVTPLRLLNAIGWEMMRYRSSGRDGEASGGAQARPGFEADSALMRKPGKKRTHPRRVAFGLPHSYFYRKDQYKPVVKPAGGERRASPLFIHVHQRSESTPPVGIVSFLPSRFLPDNQLMVDTSPVPVDETDFWNPIHGFLERLREGSHELMPAEEIPLV